MRENKYDMSADETHYDPRCVDCGGEETWNDEKQEWKCTACFPQNSSETEREVEDE